MDTNSNTFALLAHDDSGRGRARLPPGGGKVALALPDDAPPRLLAIGEVARMLCISKRLVWRLHAAGYLPEPVKILGSVYWPDTDIESWIVAGCPRQRNHPPDGTMRNRPYGIELTNDFRKRQRIGCINKQLAENIGGEAKKRGPADKDRT